MKKSKSYSVIITLLCLLVLSGCSAPQKLTHEQMTQEVDDYLHGVSEKDGSRVFHTGEPRINADFNGTIITHFSNGKKSAEIEYQEGRPHGVWLQWYDTGKTRYEGRYEHGLRHGIWKEYTKEGVLANKTNWDKGKKSNRLPNKAIEATS